MVSAAEKFRILARVAQLVEEADFENRCTRKRTQGSNPCLSAISSPLRVMSPRALETASRPLPAGLPFVWRSREPRRILGSPMKKLR